MGFVQEVSIRRITTELYDKNSKQEEIKLYEFHSKSLFINHSTIFQFFNIPHILCLPWE